jgi:hypothetical protein
MDTVAMIKHQHQRPAIVVVVVVALMRTPLACRLSQLLYLPKLFLHQHPVDFTAFHHHLVHLAPFLSKFCKNCVSLGLIAVYDEDVDQR